jgi:hypothetical protein
VFGGVFVGGEGEGGDFAIAVAFDAVGAEDGGDVAGVGDGGGLGGVMFPASKMQPTGLTEGVSMGLPAERARMASSR